MIRLIRYIWVVSLLIFLAISLFYYTLLPDTLSFAEISSSNLILTKGQFFYSSIAVIGVINIILIILKWIVPILPKGVFLTPQKTLWFSSGQTKKSFYAIIKGSVNGIAIIINLFLSYCFILGFYFNSERTKSSTEPVWGIYLSSILFIIWIFYFIKALNGDTQIEIDE